MFGVMLLDKEAQELEYLIKKELDDLVDDLNNKQLNNIVRRAMEERYQILFNIFKRFANQGECLKYIR